VGVGDRLSSKSRTRDCSAWGLRTADQYRATTTMAATSNAAISDKARSSRFEEGFPGAGIEWRHNTKPQCAGLLAALRLSRERPNFTGGLSSPQASRARLKSWVSLYTVVSTRPPLLALEAAVVEAAGPFSSFDSSMRFCRNSSSVAARSQKSALTNTAGIRA